MVLMLNHEMRDECTEALSEDAPELKRGCKQQIVDCTVPAKRPTSTVQAAIEYVTCLESRLDDCNDKPSALAHDERFG